MTENTKQRIAMGVEYDGSEYSGWQYQGHTQNTVQYDVEKALSAVADEAIQVHCAGRTDAGVHGSEQVIHFDTLAERSLRGWVYGANANLPKKVCVLWAKEVDDNFHARFSATARRYRYIILNRAIRPAVLNHRVTWEYRALDADKMHSAAQALVGEHDFTSYRAVACQAKKPVRELRWIRVSRHGQYVVIDVEADGFLHHMVRNIAGVLMDIGAGKAKDSWAAEVLAHRDRNLGGVTAPPWGLYLARITYPESFKLPQLSLDSPVW
ncbi:MAG: tRNA pseudouridine(38-40) synthase TruA [Gammaproteobacteria bacterium]|nr:tRNA pseudouridine(38-40) synthase TruA [Gammaproteobacteria bacterium]